VSAATDAAVTFFLDVDRRDWAAIRAGLADEVEVDYTELFGGRPERLPAEELVARWRALLPGFDSTQHHLGPPATVAGADDQATLECTVRAHHRIGAREWLVAAWYRLDLRRSSGVWRIAAITVHVISVEGDTGLPAEAAARAG